MLAQQPFVEHLFLLSGYHLADDSLTWVQVVSVATNDSRRFIPRRCGLDEHLAVLLVIEELDTTLREFVEGLDGTVGLSLCKLLAGRCPKQRLEVVLQDAIFRDFVELFLPMGEDGNGLDRRVTSVPMP